MFKRVRPRSSDADEFEKDTEPFHVSRMVTEEETVYNLFIFGVIKDAEQFIPAIEALQVAGEDDTFLVNISTPGGDIDATDTFLQALEATEARVVYIASGGVHSAGTLILMRAHPEQVAFSDGFNALVHNGAVGFGSKYSDWVSAAAYTKGHMDGLMRSAYRGFLSDDEIEAMLNGKDYWFGAEEFRTRLQNRYTLLMSE
jgi:ATP-dependent protease ClpP protease subunit